MEIIRNQEDTNLTFTLKGRLDTTTASDLEKALAEMINEDIEEFVMDFTDLEYVSSAGLRVVLVAQKKMNALGGSMVIRNVNESVLEVFEITGFVDILTIEE